MKKVSETEKLIDKSHDVINSGMALFSQVNQQPAPDMLKEQFRLIQMLDNLLRGISATSPRISEPDKASEPPISTSNQSELPGRLGSIPSKDDIPGVCRYLLACWLDELFVMETDWSRAWNESKLELTLFGTNDRAWRFWDFANSNQASSNEAIKYVAFSCVMHGFQGQMIESPAGLSKWVDKLKAEIIKSSMESWTPPPSLPIKAEVPELNGYHKVENAVRMAIVILIVIVPVFSFLIVFSLRK